MKTKVFFCAFIAFTRLIDASDVTTASESEGVNATLNVNRNESTELFKVEPREESTTFDITTIATLSSTTDSQSDENRKIPPTLLNTNIGFTRESSEKPTKSSKDLGSPTPNLHPKVVGHNIGHDRVKQAIINSKQNAFRHSNMFSVKNEAKSNDQVAKSNEVKTDVAKESPKEFLPSPEVSPLFNRENEVQNHFHPMNHYYRPTKQDAHFPTVTPFSSNPAQLDTRWLGGNQPPHEYHHSTPPDYMRPPLQPQGRHTLSNFPFFGNLLGHHHQQHQQNEDRVTFPSAENSNSEEPKNFWQNYNHQVPALNFKHPKGTWKWIPDEDDRSSYHGTESSSAFPYENSHQTSHDRPYSFVSPTSTSHFPDTGSGAWPSSASGSESLLASEEYPPSSKHQDHLQNIDVKQSRNPWKKIIHVMTAAIPIGLIISALTPRIVYVHPNATGPGLQQPFLPPNQPFPPGPFPTGPGVVGPQGPQGQVNGQVNGPFPQRQRVETSNELIDESLTNFLKVMEAKFQEKQQLGEKLDGSCEDRFFCEIALTGRFSDAAEVHRKLYQVALETPDEQARISGLGDIFQAIKQQNCNIFTCSKMNF